MTDSAETKRRVALITGGTRGIGLGIARQLAQEGFDLALSGRRPEAEVATTLEELRRLGANVSYSAGDIADSTSREALVAHVREAHGALHLLVNNAGMAPRERRDILEASEESFAEVVKTNLQGPYFLTQACARWMIEQKRAQPEERLAIVNIGSISATVASVNRGEYCIAKTGLAMATQLFAARLGEYGIPVYEVRPGITRTDMTSGVRERYDKLIAEGLTVTPRWGEPEDIARAVAALARGDFAYSTGQAFVVDGGLTLPRL